MGSREEKSRKASEGDSFHLPFSRVTEDESRDVLLNVCEWTGPDLFPDLISKLETSIDATVNEQIDALRNLDFYQEEELEEIQKHLTVLSPITLSLYWNEMQFERNKNMTEADKERYLLDSFPGRFKARFKENAANRNSRDVTDAELAMEAQNEKDRNSTTTYTLRDVIAELFNLERKAYIRNTQTKEAGNGR